MENIPKIIIHRSGGFMAPENTIAAMKIGSKLNVDGLELDVSFTKDNVPVVYHDDNLKRTTGIDKPIKKVLYDDLKNLDNGSWFSEEFKDEKIATLEEYLKAHAGKTNLFVEIKEDNKNLFEIPSLVEQYNMLDKVTFISFRYRVLLKVKKTFPQVKFLFLIGDKLRRPFFMSKNKKVDGYGLSYKLANRNERYLKKVLRTSKEVNIWSCNDMKIANKLISLGVSSITTDVPNKLIDLVESLKKQ
jgi:glycerophosphoryl diester phosphodiesterase